MTEILCSQGHVMNGNEERCSRCNSLPVKAAAPEVASSTAPVASNKPLWEQESFNPGAIPSEPDPRDYPWSDIGMASDPFNWETGYDVEAELGFALTSNDQNGSGSCGGQAFSKYDAVQRFFFDKTFGERSAKYLYSQVFAPGGGSSARALSKTLISQGDSSEALCTSYDNGQPPSEAFMERVQDITPAARDDAPNAQSRAYAAVAIDIDDIAQAIGANYGVVIGLRGSNNGTWGSEFPTAPIDSDPTKWAHYMYFGKAKMINGVKFVGGLQSWGAGIGLNGWQFLSEEYINAKISLGAVIFEAWTLTFNPNPTPDSFSHTFVVDMHFGDNDAEITQLQTALAKDGEFPAGVPTTGYYGSITAQAVLKFQLKYAVAPVEELNSLQGKTVGPATRAKLNELFGAK